MNFEPGKYGCISVGCGVVKPQVLYLSYTGMLEPLGRSQVLSYLLRLSSDYTFTLASFEKPEDLEDQAPVASLMRGLKDQGIGWMPHIYHRRPRLFATVWDLLALMYVSLRLSIRRDVCMLHCRSYIPAISAWLCGKVTRKPFIFDMRAIWPDEMVTAGRLNERSVFYKTLKWTERRLLRNAASVVSLTGAGVDHLLERYPELPREKFEVITTCVDVDRFGVPERHGLSGRLVDRQPFVVGTMGTLLSGWFYLDAFFAFFLAIKRLRSDAQMSIVTRDNQDEIRARAHRAGVGPEDINLRSATSEEMPQLLAGMDVGVMFYAPDVGRAPTRLGEFLAAGVPVVGNTGIGDLGRLIAAYEVGVVVDDVYDTASLEHAAQELLRRYEGILAEGACRRAAEDYFSVEQGAERYRQMYQSVLSR